MRGASTQSTSLFKQGHTYCLKLILLFQNRNVSQCRKTLAEAVSSGVEHVQVKFFFCRLLAGFESCVKFSVGKTYDSCEANLMSEQCV